MKNATRIGYDAFSGVFNMDENKTGVPNAPEVLPVGGRVPLVLSQSVNLVAGHTYQLEFFLASEGAWQGSSCSSRVSMGMIRVDIGTQTLYVGTPNDYDFMGQMPDRQRFHFRFKALTSGAYSFSFTSYGRYIPGSLPNSVANKSYEIAMGDGLAQTMGIGIDSKISTDLILDDVILNDVTVNLGGKVFNDPTGNSNGMVDGTPIDPATGPKLYAVLVNPSNNLIYDAVAVDAAGSYNFVIWQNASYKVLLSSTKPDAGVMLGRDFTRGPLPPGWQYTGEQWPSGTGFDASQADGIYDNITVNTTDISDLNFGVRQLATVSVSGNVFNDGDGLRNSLVNGSGIGYVSGVQLYANLVNATTGNVLSAVPVASNGTFAFSGLVTNASYTVQITQNQGTVGSAKPAPALPSNWEYAGNQLGTVAGANLLPSQNGTEITVTAGTSNITNVNFGLDQRPVAYDLTVPSQPNPGGLVSIPGLPGSDPEDGTYPGTAPYGFEVLFPLVTGGSLIYDGRRMGGMGGPYWMISNYNPALLKADPNDDGPVTLSFKYRLMDAAGVPSLNEGTLTMSFTVPITLRGSVWVDYNGMTNSMVDFYYPVYPYRLKTPAGLNAVLVNPATGNVLATMPVPEDGSFSFANQPPKASYKVVISTTAGTVGSPAPAPSVPPGWVFTGDQLGVTAAGIDGAPLGEQTVQTGIYELLNINFGIQQPPVSDSKAWTVTQADFNSPVKTISGTTWYGIPATSSALAGYNSTGGALSGTDPEDCAGASACSNGKTYIIQTVNTGTKVYYNGTEVTAGQSLANFDPSNLAVYGAKGESSVGFTYSLVDAAAIASTPTPYTISVNAPLPVTLVSFNGNLEENHAVLNWKTSSEERFSHFEVLSSLDAKQFEYAGVVKSNGNARGSSYRFDAGVPAAPIVYYRLRMVDTDGTAVFSKAISVESGNNTVTVFPNPTRDVLNIRTGSDGTFTLHDVLGRQVSQGQLQTGDNAIPLQKAARGVYLLKTETSGKKQTVRILVTN